MNSLVFNSTCGYWLGDRRDGIISYDFYVKNKHNYGLPIFIVGIGGKVRLKEGVFVINRDFDLCLVDCNLEYESLELYQQSLKLYQQTLEHKYKHLISIASLVFQEKCLKILGKDLSDLHEEITQEVLRNLHFFDIKDSVYNSLRQTEWYKDQKKEKLSVSDDCPF